MAKEKEVNEQSKFLQALELNVNEMTEKKNGLTYLSWAPAWREFKKIYNDATYKVKRYGEAQLPYVVDETGYMVATEITADGETHEMWLPVMNHKNQALKRGEATMFDVNKAIMRCFTKNLAMFGLGLYVYTGEDLPEAGDVKPVDDNAKLIEAIKLGIEQAKTPADLEKIKAGINNSKKLDKEMKITLIRIAELAQSKLNPQEDEHEPTGETEITTDELENFIQNN